MLVAQEQEREDVVLARQAWMASQDDLDPDRVTFLDETWAKTNMTRTLAGARMAPDWLRKLPVVGGAGRP